MFTIDSGIPMNREPLDKAPWGLMEEGQSFFVSEKIAMYAVVSKACIRWSALLGYTFTVEKEGRGSRVFLISKAITPQNNIQEKIKEVICSKDGGETLGIIINKLRRFGRKLVVETLNEMTESEILKVSSSIHPRKMFKIMRYTIA